MIKSFRELFDYISLYRDALSSEDVAYDEISQKQLQALSLELLRDNNSPEEILKDRIVILMHQGYTFSCVNINSPNGPVFTYTEITKEIVYVFSTVQEFILEYCG